MDGCSGLAFQGRFAVPRVATMLTPGGGGQVMVGQSRRCW